LDLPLRSADSLSPTTTGDPQESQNASIDVRLIFSGKV
jgi:hypothetical protein